MEAALLTKVRTSPGLCTKDEIKQVFAFYQDLWEKVSLFKEVTGLDPIELTLPTLMDRLQYYLK